MSFYLCSDTPFKRKKSDHIHYFDNNSTTLIEDETVRQEIVSWISCGNPSNILHSLGREAHDKIEECRHTVAYDLKVDPTEVYFTSGATESNNMIILGSVKKYLRKKKRVTMITSSFEHPSVYNVFKHLETDENLNIVFIPICNDKNDDRYGTILPEDIDKTITNAEYPVKMVSIMYANNETGGINDIEEIGKICAKHKIFFHCDATQAIGKYIIHPKKLGIHAMTFSGHKFHGPKGVGGLFLDKTKRCEPNICYGGEQENHKRPGTENVANIAGMVQALRIAHTNRDEKNKKLLDMREYIENKVRGVLDIEIIGSQRQRLPNTILMLIKDMGNCNKVLVRKLDQKKICVSIGSACQTQKKISHVLDAMNLTKEDAVKIIRISLSDYTTEDEVRYFVNTLCKIVKDIQKGNVVS